MLGVSKTGKACKLPDLSGKLIALDALRPGTSRHMALIPMCWQWSHRHSTGDPTGDRHWVWPLGNTGTFGMSQRGQVA